MKITQYNADLNSSIKMHKTFNLNRIFFHFDWILDGKNMMRKLA